jgi:hypothetical protein
MEMDEVTVRCVEKPWFEFESVQKKREIIGAVRRSGRTAGWLDSWRLQDEEWKDGGGLDFGVETETCWSGNCWMEPWTGVKLNFWTGDTEKPWLLLEWKWTVLVLMLKPQSGICNGSKKRNAKKKKMNWWTVVETKKIWWKKRSMLEKETDERNIATRKRKKQKVSEEEEKEEEKCG